MSNKAVQSRESKGILPQTLFSNAEKRNWGLLSPVNKARVIQPTTGNYTFWNEGMTEARLNIMRTIYPYYVYIYFGRI
jgi:hypothetical protein